MLNLIWVGLVIGAGATILMDLWLVFLWKVVGESKFTLVPMGRWFGYLFHGRVVHADIAASEPLAYEHPLGWLFHYGVGMLYGVILTLLAGARWVAHPTFLPAWILGIVTVGAGWFILQPGLGLGWAASKTSRPNKVRLLNLVAHTVFAVGLWGTALLLL